MDSYRVADVTSTAKAITNSHNGDIILPPAPPMTLIHPPRNVDVRSLSPAGSGKVSVKDIGKIYYGSEDISINLRSLEQMVEVSQVNAIADLMQQLSSSKVDQQQISLVDLVAFVESRIDAEGLDAMGLSNRQSFGCYARPRRFEMAAAINRWRNLKIT